MTERRRESPLAVIPDPYEEGLTPQVPGLSAISEFEPLPHDHADSAREADNIINGNHSASSVISGNNFQFGRR